MTKEQKLEYIWDAMKKAYPNRRLVFNDGSPDAQVMIIGEAPGMDEERTGLPFVGRAGKLLNSTLEQLGWKRTDFYVSNIVKYRPADERGGNRTPTEEEIKKFKPSIEKEIEVVDPKLVVLLGRIAMTAMGFLGSMGAYRGKVVRYNGRPMLITYHPAAILRNINWEPMFREDLSQIRSIIEGKAQSEESESALKSQKLF